ncbi:MAG: hypothetical protein WA109_09430 [Bellilinea sp.]
MSPKKELGKFLVHVVVLVHQAPRRGLNVQPTDSNLQKKVE